MQGKEWIRLKIQEVSEKFASHIISKQIKDVVRAEDIYVDFLVVERKSKDDMADRSREGEVRALRLADVPKLVRSPVLLLGDGGGGKTTSMLHLALTAAKLSVEDRQATIPVYVNLARLTKIDDLADLHQLIADSVPLVKDWNGLCDLGIFERRSFLFL